MFKWFKKIFNKKKLNSFGIDSEKYVCLGASRLSYGDIVFYVNFFHTPDDSERIFVVTGLDLKNSIDKLAYNRHQWMTHVIPMWKDKHYPFWYPVLMPTPYLDDKMEKDFSHIFDGEKWIKKETPKIIETSDDDKVITVDFKKDT